MSKETDSKVVVVEFDKSSGKYTEELFGYLESERCRKLKKKTKAEEPPQLLHVISREEVESCNVKRLLAEFGLSLPAEELREMRGRVRFAIAGYDHAQEELCEIPTVRKFIRRASKYWGGWNFFASLETSWLSIIACCHAERMRVVKRAGASVFVTGVHGVDWISYYNDSLQNFAHYSFQADISLDDSTVYIKRVAENLGLGESE